MSVVVQARAVRPKLISFPFLCCQPQLFFEGFAGYGSRVVVGLFFETVYDAGDIVNTALLREEVMQVGQELKANSVMEVVFGVCVRV